MGMEAAVLASVTPIVSVCVASIYEGDAAEYCQVNMEELPTAYGDDAPHAVRYMVQVHYYYPRTNFNPTATKKALRRALGALGGTWPQVTNASDEVSGHLVFEFETVDGDL